jgi:hypothetical protein
MTAPRPIQALVAFLKDVLLHRDRYMLEVVSSLVTFAAGVLASMTQLDLASRQSMNGFRDMPVPEVWVCLAALPGTIQAILNFRNSQEGGACAIAVMGTFWVLSMASGFAGLDNWIFWTLFALLLGAMQGYAIARDLRDLRWGVAFLGAFFWIALTATVLANVGWPWPIAVVTYGGWALANLLSVRRLSMKAG